jgi:hypothetical protein
MKNRLPLFLQLLGILAILISAFLPVIRPLFIATFAHETTGELKRVAVAVDPSISVGDSPISYGPADLGGFLLLLPAILAIYLIVRLIRHRFDTSFEDSPHLLGVSALSLISLAVWWAQWTTFKVVPAIGFWVALVGIVLVAIAGFLVRSSA